MQQTLTVEMREIFRNVHSENMETIFIVLAFAILMRITIKCKFQHWKSWHIRALVFEKEILACYDFVDRKLIIPFWK